jgi:diamine N-acetyltransferase
MAHPNVIIRPAQAIDADLLAELGARTFAETFAADNTPENMGTYLASAFNRSQQAAELADSQTTFLVAEQDGTAVGYAMLRAGSELDDVTGNNPIELVRLYVSSACLGSGVGAALMHACISEAEQRGHETIWLGVWERNHRAQSFYRKWYFREVGTHIFQLGDDPQTDLIMQRSISAV